MKATEENGFELPENSLLWRGIYPLSRSQLSSCFPAAILNAAILKVCLYIGKKRFG